MSELGGGDETADAEAQAAAHLAPGGPVAAVIEFRRRLSARDLVAAAELVDAVALENVPYGLAGLDLGFLDEPGWGISGRSRPQGLDSEIVLYVRTGEDAVVISQPTLLPTYAITVRLGSSGWRITHFEGEIRDESGESSVAP
jgi:hypothetical protein